MLRNAVSIAFVSLLFFSCNNSDNAATVPPVKTPVGASQNTPTQTAPQENATAGDTAAQSVTALEKRHAFVPSNPAVAYDLAYAYAGQKNRKAVQLADSLIKAKAPEIEKAHYIKADFFSRTNNVKEALKEYDAAIAANYHFLDAYFDKGRLLFAQKQYEEALKSFALGQKMSPGAAEFYLWVAKTQEAMGNRADAKMNYERAYALDKSLTEAKEAADRL